MIRNIVFDMGGVLMWFDPTYIASQVPVKEESKPYLDKVLFRAPEWAKLDEGTLNEEELAAIVYERLPEWVHEDVPVALAHWHEHMLPMKTTFHLVKELKKAGYHLYLLSNASRRFHTYENDVPAFHYFDGLFISADHLCLKPQPIIYEKFLKQFNLNPEECLFIDDLPANIAGGKAAKMDGIVYTGDVNQLRQELREHGINVKTEFQLVRVFDDADRLRLSRLAEEVWHQHFDSLLPPGQTDYMIEKFQSYEAMGRQMAEERYQYYLFYEPGTEGHEGYHGYTGFRIDEDALFLSKLYVLQPYRNRRLSSQALDFLITTAQNNGCKKIWLTVNRYNDHTVEIYKHWGFQVVREQCADIGNGYVMDDFIMELPVPDWRTE